jgi:thiosulfate/3-mercaptopyruvate sulfurtransferase
MSLDHLDPLISPVELRARPGALLFDCRTGPKAREAYAEGHLPGAVFADLETDLAAPTAHPERGGRHPLPDAARFAARLGEWGVTPASHVVVYDDQGGANAAARMWWMLRSLGHRYVQLLDGGLQAALAEGFTLTRDPAQRSAQPPYPEQAFGWPTADIHEVERARARPERRVLDVRATPRYRGETEPIDPLAGHIPGAINLPFAENLRGGRFKSAEELRDQYLNLLSGVDPKQLIVHCGSGVTAAHTLLALERAGLPGAKLYVGSWGEWCRNPDRAKAP